MNPSESRRRRSHPLKKFKYSDVYLPASHNIDDDLYETIKTPVNSTKRKSICHVNSSDLEPLETTPPRPKKPKDHISKPSQCSLSETVAIKANKTPTQASETSVIPAKELSTVRLNKKISTEKFPPGPYDRQTSLRYLDYQTFWIQTPPRLHHLWK